MVIIICVGAGRSKYLQCLASGIQKKYCKTCSKTEVKSYYCIHTPVFILLSYIARTKSGCDSTSKLWDGQ